MFETVLFLLLALALLLPLPTAISADAPDELRGLEAGADGAFPWGEW